MPTELSNFPTLIVEIAFSTEPRQVPSWDDVTAYVRTLSLRRGRNDELGRMEAGTCRLTLSNRDRRFDPSHTSSPYYPYVKPMRKIRVRATWSAVTYTLFTGYIERWPQKWRGQEDAYVNIEATDGFEPLAQAEVTQSFSAQLAGTRIAAILDEISWSAFDRNLDAGKSVVSAETLTGVPALQHISDVAMSERGYVFMSGDGKVTYHDRHKRLNGSYIVSQATFGDQGSELPYTDAVFEYDKDKIKNHITVARDGGSTFLSQDTTSITSYFRRSYSLNPKIATDVEAKDLADFILGEYKDPRLDVKELTLEGRMSGTALWPQLLGRELGDRITIKRTPPGGGSRISTDNHIESINHDYKKEGSSWKWTTK